EQVAHSSAGDRLVHETVLGDSARTGGRTDQDGEAPLAAELRQHVPESVQRFLAPSLTFHWTTKHRLVVVGGGLLVLLALLANSAGTALVVASGIVVILLALTLLQQDLFERESPALIMAVGVIGGVIGIVIGTVNSWLTSSDWFDSGTLNYGAAGFGGRFADLGGAAPLSVWLLNGLILPLIAIAGIAAAPVALRRLPQFRNEVMDGVILVGSSAAGYAISTALVYWSPMLGNRGPQTDVSDWTLTLIGVVILRPVVITLAGAMLGAGIWRYMVTPSIARILLPAVGSVGAFLLLAFGSIQLQPAGLWAEVIWTLLLSAATFAVYRVVLKGAITEDRKAMGSDGGRMVCPSCQQITPAGAFCANCGEPLPEAAGTGKASRTTSAPGGT
ncbi:MAG TPA: zinc ribbon domain-containing protein, partial [Thermomicrobiales bacterium]|nr:zinc ribbon domain-containing protein [Thermomicrobiales bacterium]